MALISCSECGKAVSDKATNCPSCGNPIAIADGAFVTTQKTSKSLKAGMIGSFAVIGVGLVAISQAPGFGGILVLIGLIWLIWANMAAWWRHG